MYIEVSDLKNEFYEEIQFNLTKFGFYIQIKVTNNQLIFLQSFQSFKFLKLKENYFSIDKINPKIILPIEEDDEDEDLLNLFNSKNKISNQEEIESGNSLISSSTSKTELYLKEFSISILDGNEENEKKNYSENLKFAINSLDYLFDSQEISKEEYDENMLFLEKFERQ